jgi:hypothetical protein
MGFRLIWIEMSSLAISRYEHLHCQINYMRETAAVHEQCNHTTQGIDKLNFPLLWIVFLPCGDLQACSKFFHHCRIIACIITGDMANLHHDSQSNGPSDDNNDQVMAMLTARMTRAGARCDDQATATSRAGARCEGEAWADSDGGKVMAMTTLTARECVSPCDNESRYEGPRAW